MNWLETNENTIDWLGATEQDDEDVIPEEEDESF